MPYNKTLVVVASFLGGRNCLTHFFFWRTRFSGLFFAYSSVGSLSVYCRSHAGYGSSKKANGMAMLTFCLERNSLEWIYEEKLCSTYFKSSNCLILFFFLHESSNESQHHHSLWSGPLNLYHK